MEDYIYILLAIVWLVISILGSKKKKQARQAGQPTPTAEPKPIEADPLPKNEKSDFEDLLDDFFGSDTTTKEKPREQEEKERIPADAPYFKSVKEDHEYSFYGEQYDPKLEKFQGEEAIEDDFEFAAEGKVETLEDLIKSYERSEQKSLEEDAKIAVVDLDEAFVRPKDFEFDARKAIIYAEIINRKYT